ncbi:MAG: hypothetical protein U1C33_07900, partial [Candidatus Cloacimonadaceae bacterium]|nr:hypothetical protein [Candidatus Cloacimonadaceae bacterium]
ENPHEIDLRNIGIGEMLAMQSPLCRLSSCVAAGYLKPVSNWERLDKLIINLDDNPDSENRFQTV